MIFDFYRYTKTKGEKIEIKLRIISVRVGVSVRVIPRQFVHIVKNQEKNK